MIEIITSSMAAGETKTFLIAGEYIEVVEAQYPVDLLMMDRSGGQLSAMRASEASFFSRPGRFETVQVYSASAQTIRIFVGSGDAGTRRVSGLVQVIDGSKARSVSGVSFWASSSGGSAAGEVAQMSIYNPVGTGRRLVVNSVMAQLSVSGTVDLIGGSGVPLGDPLLITSKAVGMGMFSIARKHDYSGLTPSGNRFGVIPMSSTSPVHLNLSEPMVINPGYFFALRAGVSGSVITCVAQFFEEVI